MAAEHHKVVGSIEAAPALRRKPLLWVLAFAVQAGIIALMFLTTGPVSALSALSGVTRSSFISSTWVMVLIAPFVAGAVVAAFLDHRGRGGQGIGVRLSSFSST